MALSPLFPFSERAHALHAELDRFVRERVLPAEADFDAHICPTRSSVPACRILTTHHSRS